MCTSSCSPRSPAVAARSITSYAVVPISTRSTTATSRGGPMTATTEREAEAAVEQPEAKPERLTGGWRIVARKEFTDHIHSVRFVILVVLMALAGLASVHSASGP